MRVQEMNFVNIIGRMVSAPQIVQLKDGKKMAKFSLTTKETYLDEEGNTKELKNWHRISAWGKWVPVLEELCEKGQALAIEGRLRSRFFHSNGTRQSITEIEVNDLIIL